MIKQVTYEPDERPSVLYAYYVTGEGEFPLDMLRRGAAWPASEGDVGFMESRRLRSILLRSYRKPDEDAWSNEGWAVSDQSVVEDKDAIQGW